MDDFEFNWQYPKLSIKIVNNTNKTLYLTEIVVKVKSSTINKNPILLIANESWNNVYIVNEG